MANKITTLYEDSAKTNALYPRTKISAISDDNGNSLSNMIVYKGQMEESGSTTPLDADLLNGHPDTYFSPIGNIATIESSPSTQAHAVGEYIVYNSQLYKVISAIAVNDNLVSGTNIQSTNIGNALNSYEFEYFNIGNFVGSISRFGRLRIISVYNGAGEQAAITKQLASKDYPVNDVTVGAWLPISDATSYGSRYLTLNTSGVLYTGSSVTRGGWTMVYIAKQSI